MLSLGASNYVNISGIDSFQNYSQPKSQELNLDSYITENNTKIVNFSNKDPVYGEYDQGLTAVNNSTTAEVLYRVGDFEEIDVYTNPADKFLIFPSSDLEFQLYNQNKTQISSSIDVLVTGNDRFDTIPLDDTLLYPSVSGSRSIEFIKFNIQKDDTYIFKLDGRETKKKSNLQRSLNAIIEVFTLQSKSKWFNYLIAIPMLIVGSFISLKLLIEIIPL